ncbi:MAG: hypothetical protein ABDH32_03190 [Candidatus Caldarchaeales archaeon]
MNMIVGSINLLRFIEFFHTLHDINYDGWYDLDIYPYREDPIKACEQSIKFVDYILTTVKEHYQELSHVIKLDNPYEALETVWRIFLKGF